jgi:hypothetical protein
MMMLRKGMIALLAAVAVGLAAPTMALARGGGGEGGGGHGGGGGGFGGHGGGGFGGGGFGGHAGGFGGHAGFGGGAFHGGFHGGGFAGRGFHGFGHRFAFGGGVYPYYDDYAFYPYDDYYDDSDNCYVVQRHVHTTYGWRWQPAQVCA